MHNRWRQEGGARGDSLLGATPAALQCGPGVQLQQGSAGARPPSLQHSPDRVPHLKGIVLPLWPGDDTSTPNAMILVHHLPAAALSCEGDFLAFL